MQDSPRHMPRHPRLPLYQILRRVNHPLPDHHSHRRPHRKPPWPTPTLTHSPEATLLSLSGQIPPTLTPSPTPTPLLLATPLPAAMQAKLISEIDREHRERCRHYMREEQQPVTYMEFLDLDPDNMSDLGRVLWGSLIRDDESRIHCRDYWSDRLPKRLLIVSTTSSGTPHGVGTCGISPLLGGPDTPSLFHSQLLATASPTLGSTPVGGTNCARVALGMAGEIYRGILVSVMSAAAARTRPPLFPSRFVPHTAHVAQAGRREICISLNDFRTIPAALVLQLSPDLCHRGVCQITTSTPGSGYVLLSEHAGDVQ